MARHIVEMLTDKPDETIAFIARDFLTKEGFAQQEYKGEVVWKKGHGLMTAPQFIKVTSEQGKLHLEAWIKFAWLPGVYSGEMDLSGFFGAVPKKMLKSRVDGLLALLIQNGNIPTA